MRAKILGLVALLAVAGVAFTFFNRQEKSLPDDFPAFEADGPEGEGLQTATFGTGCFWCTEAVFLQLKGVQKVVPGYTGGAMPNPTYKDICTGKTGHAEAIQITYDPTVISYAELLEVFWRSHDPTTLNRQGNDVGTQYRSAIFYHTPKQKELAEKYKQKIEDAHAFESPVVTEIVPTVEFYPAEAYHHNYYASNSKAGYCRTVIRPKLDKLQKAFPQKLKANGE